MRKFMKCFLFGVAVLTFLCAFSGCDKMKALTEKELISAVNASEITSYCEGVRIPYFEDEYCDTAQSLTVKSLTIVKRQTNIQDKQDIVHCTITLQNERIKRTTDYTLYLNFYDTGGWVLDYVSQTGNHTFAPLMPPTDELLSKLEKNSYWEWGKSFDEMNTKTTTGSVNGNNAEVYYNLNATGRNFYYNADVRIELSLSEDLGLWTYSEREILSKSYVFRDGAIKQYTPVYGFNKMGVTIEDYDDTDVTLSFVYAEAYGGGFEVPSQKFTWEALDGFVRVKYEKKITSSYITLLKYIDIYPACVEVTYETGGGSDIAELR